MRSLTMRRRRPSGTPRRSIEPRRRRWLVPQRTHCAALIFCTLLTSGQAAAQRSPVAVDLGALDALGPAPANPGANPSGRVRLHPPNPPAERKASTPATAKAAPAAAGAPRPAPAATQASVPPPVSKTPPAPAAGPDPAAPSQVGIATPAPAVPPSSGEVRAVVVPGEIAERILFPPDDAQLPGEAKAELDRLAARLGSDGRLYVQLVAYAGGGNDASQARRLSLSRALAARAYLVEHGVEIKQIDVRPLGNRSVPGLAPDRIDLVVAQR
jgi:outer membrane protein OmpA-like peptidoglycan-associated protein